MDWQLHWLEASGDLGPWKETIAAEVKATEAHLATRTPPPRLNILVQRVPGRGIPEIGMVGHAYGRSLFGLTLDPENGHFEASLHDGTLRRQVAHGVHHCMRMAGPGYGNTLGEALVSEGLAGRFTRWLFGNPPEPWERAVAADALRAHASNAAALASTDDDHDAWFFGVGGRHPRCLGYTIGYALVGAWLDREGVPDAVTWIGVPARAGLDAAGPDRTCCSRDHRSGPAAVLAAALGPSGGGAIGPAAHGRAPGCFPPLPASPATGCTAGRSPSPGAGTARVGP